MADPKSIKTTEADKDDLAKVEGPSPTQAELDAIREGKRPTQKREVKAEAAATDTLTR